MVQVLAKKMSKKMYKNFFLLFLLKKFFDYFRNQVLDQDPSLSSADPGSGSASKLNGS